MHGCGAAAAFVEQAGIGRLIWIKDRRLPSLARLVGDALQAAMVCQQRPQLEGRPEGRQAARLVAKHRRVALGGIGDRPQARQRHVATQPEQARRIEPGSRQQSAERRLEQDIHRQTSRRTASLARSGGA